MMGQGGEDSSGMVCWGLFTDAVIEREREGESERERVEKGILAGPCLHNAHAVLQVKSG